MTTSNMAATTQTELLRKSGDRFIFIFMMLLMFFMASRTPIDNDLWWHLRAGQVTVETGKPLLTDLFSFTRYGADWHNHSWLAQVLIYVLYQWGGTFALGFMVAGLATISLGLVYTQMECPAIVRAGFLVLVAIVESWLWSPRPQLYSLALLSGLGYILYLYKWRRIDRLWILPPLFILWSNLHAGYSLGFLLIGALIIGELVNHIPGYPAQAALPWKAILRLGIWGLVSGLVVVINPNGVETWLVPFQTVQIQALQQYISEWASPDFHDIGQQTFLWLLFATLGAAAISRRKMDGSDLVSLVLFAYMSFLARRNLGPFAVVAGPILARYAWPVLQDSGKALADKFPEVANRIHVRNGTARNLPDGVRKWINLGFTGGILLIGVVRLFVMASPQLVTSDLLKTYPVQAVDWIRQNRPQERILNSYDWGGYLEWFLPGYPVFVDGRTDLYNDEIIGEWVQVVNLMPGWKEVLDRWGIRLILLKPERPVVSALAQNGWKLLYQDKVAVVYGR